MVRALFFYQFGGPHRAHEPFIEVLDADYRHFETGALPTPDREDQNLDSLGARLNIARSCRPNYEVVIGEGSAALQTAMLYKLLINRDATVVFLACDQTFKNKRFVSDTLWTAITPVTNRVVDCCVAISNLVDDWIAPYFRHTPRHIVHPTTTEEKFEALTGINPRSSADPFVVLSAGRYQPMKNFDLIVSTVAEIREHSERDIELVLLGPDHDTQPYANRPFVTTPGFVSVAEFHNWFQQATLYAQPSRADGLGVAVLEAMLAGLPVVVSPEVGAKSFLLDEWVVSADREALAARIKRTADMSVKERRDVGMRNREAVSHLTPERQAKRFKNVVRSVMENE